MCLATERSEDLRLESQTEKRVSLLHRYQAWLHTTVHSLKYLHVCCGSRTNVPSSLNLSNGTATAFRGHLTQINLHLGVFRCFRLAQECGSRILLATKIKLAGYRTLPVSTMQHIFPYSQHSCKSFRFRSDNPFSLTILA